MLNITRQMRTMIPVVLLLVLIIVKTFEIPGMAPSLARFSPYGKTLTVWHYEYQIARTGAYYPLENSKTILQLGTSTQTVLLGYVLSLPQEYGIKI